MNIKTKELPLQDALLLEAGVHKDVRGQFSKYFDNSLFHKLNFAVHEVFASGNKKGVLRGLHFQNPNPQARIVWCPYGKIWDVQVDLRKDSRTYLKWHGEELSGEKGRGVFVPRGFAHGFVALSEEAFVLYIADAPYSPETEKGIIYNDRKLGIKWQGLEGKPVLSERDAGFSKFEEKEHSY